MKPFRLSDTAVKTPLVPCSDPQREENASDKNDQYGISFGTRSSAGATSGGRLWDSERYCQMRLKSIHPQRFVMGKDRSCIAVASRQNDGMIHLQIHSELNSGRMTRRCFA